MPSLLALATVTLISASLASAWVDLPPHARGGEAWKLMKGVMPSTTHLRASPNGLNALTFNQKCDHFDKASSCTFAQRYYVDDSHFRKGGAIFLYIGGEGPLEAAPGGFAAELAQEMGAAVVALEHRFYGQSIPNGNLETDNLKLLTTFQAHEDLAHFIQTFKAEDKRFARAQVLAIGGSYPGALSAWFREKYPHVVDAAWSSSGVVNAIKNFVEFDEQISASSGDRCAALMAQTTEQLEEQWSKDADALAAKFNARRGIAKPDFFYMTADSNAMAVQYGGKSKICGALEEAAAKKESLVDAFAQFTKSFWGEDFGAGCFYDTECLKTDKTFARSWRWQKCAELAYFQNAPESNSLRSKSITMSYHLEQCSRAFGKPMEPNTKAVNEYYGGSHPRGSKTVFVDASDDPWQQASVRSNLPAEPYVYIKCNDCGHCIDLHANMETDPKQVTEAREKIASAIRQWIRAAEH